MTTVHKLNLALSALERNPNDGVAFLCALGILVDMSRSRVFRLTSKAYWRELERICQ